MRSVLATAMLATLITIAGPAAAAPLTLSCGPFPVNHNGTPGQINAIKVIIDAPARSAVLVTPSGSYDGVSGLDINDHLFRLQFASWTVMGDSTTYVLTIDRDNASSWLFLYPQPQPFTQARCAPSLRLGF